MLKRLAFLAPLILLVGCETPHGSIKSIVRRQTQALKRLPAEERARLMTPDQPVSVESSESLIEPGELTLGRARQIALQANPDIHAARARLESALARIAEARSYYMPQIALMHNSTRVFDTPNRLSRYSTLYSADPEIPSLPENPSVWDMVKLFGRRVTGNDSEVNVSSHNSISDHTTALSAQWTIFDGFIRESRLMIAKYGYLASVMSLADTERILVQAVDSAYYQAQLGREQLRIAQADLEFGQRQLESSEKLFNAGKITEATVLNFQVRVRTAQANAVAAAGTRDLGRVVLAELLGLPGAALGEDITLSDLDTETDKELTPPNVEEWIQTALRSRPDLAGARHVAKAQEENILLARGQYSPTLSLQGSWGFERTSNMTYESDDRSSAIAVELKWNLYMGGIRDALLRQARADWWEAASLVERQKLKVAAEVRQATVNLINAQEEVTLQRMNLQAATEHRRIVESEYSAGKASLVRLNEAQRDLVQTDGQLAAARVRLRRAWTDLNAAAGAYPQNGHHDKIESDHAKGDE